MYLMHFIPTFRSVVILAGFVQVDNALVANTTLFERVSTTYGGAGEARIWLIFIIDW